MKALALTDHGNMFGVFKVLPGMQKKRIKPIIGCEFYVAPVQCLLKAVMKRKKVSPSDSPRKNSIGYANLMKLSSIFFTEGFYYKPRIDFDTMKKILRRAYMFVCLSCRDYSAAYLKRQRG